MDYDPLGATVIRLGLPGGDDFFTEHVDPITAAYGDELADAFCLAVRENDLEAAERFAAVAAPGYAYEVTKSTDEMIEISYSVPGVVTGTHKTVILPESAESADAIDPAVLAVLFTAERSMRATRGYATPAPAA